MDPPDDALIHSPIHQELAKLDACDLIYTTNFDDFIERSFKLNGRACKAVAIESHMRGMTRQTEIVKFHGDWNHPDRLVLTESDYEKRMEFTTEMDLRLWSDLLNRTLLFIGYSFRDPNVSYLFRKVADRFKKLPDSEGGRRAFIIAEEPSHFERRLFQERNIEVIPIGSKDRSAEIAEILSEIRT